MGLFSRKGKNDEKRGSEPLIAQYAEIFADTPLDGVDLDYTLSSLNHVDRYLGGYHDEGRILPEEMHVVTSAYVFEVLRRAYGGRYLSGPAEDPWVLVLGEPDCQIGVMVMSKVRGRVVNGPEDSITFFVEGIAPLLERKQSATLI